MPPTSETSRPAAETPSLLGSSHGGAQALVSISVRSRARLRLAQSASLPLSKL